MRGVLWNKINLKNAWSFFFFFFFLEGETGGGRGAVLIKI